MFEEMKHCEMDWKWKRKDRATREAGGRACWKAMSAMTKCD